MIEIRKHRKQEVARALAAFLITAAFAINPVLAHNDGAYSRDSTAAAYYPNWMSDIDDSLKLTELSLPGTHDSGAYKTGGVSVETQSMSIEEQLNAGIRAFDLRVGKTPLCPLHIFHGATCQIDLSLAAVMNTIPHWLASHQTETVVIRLKKEYGEPAFADVKALLQADYYYGGSSGETKENPTLGELRGKMFIMKNGWASTDVIGPKNWLSSTCAGSSNSAAEILSRTCQDEYSLSDALDLKRKYKEWVVPYFNRADDVLGANNFNRDALYINHLSAVATAFPFPYFIASGHSNWATSAPRLATGMTRGLIDTCSGDSNCMPEYPSVSCVDFFGLDGSETCTVAYEGMNRLALNYILDHVRYRTGIVMMDFPGEAIIKAIIDLNPWREAVVADAGGPYISTENLYVVPYPGPGLKAASEYCWDTDNDGDCDTDWISPAGALGDIQVNRADDYTGKITMIARDSNGFVDRDSALLWFRNYGNGFYSLPSNIFINEGQAARLAGTIWDPGLDAQKIEIDWDGDDIYESVTQLALPTEKCAFDQRLWCTPFDRQKNIFDNAPGNLPYKAKVKVTDDDGAATKHNFNLYVLNQPPVFQNLYLIDRTKQAFIESNDILDFGTNVEVFFSWTDTVEDTFDVRITWHDGSDQEHINNPPENGVLRQHVYSTAGQYQISMRVTDDDGGVSILWSDPFIVGEEPPPPPSDPVADAGGPYIVPEGSPVIADASGSVVDATLLDHARYRWDMDGDGTWDTERTSSHLSPPWYGPDPGEPDDYMGTILVELWDGSKQSVASAQVTFTNVEPIMSVTTNHFQILEGELAVINFSVEDPGTDPITLDFDWDEDNIDDENLTLDPGTTDYVFTHVYPDEPDDGEHLVRVKAADGDGGLVEDFVTFRISNADPQIAVTSFTDPELNRVPQDVDVILVGTTLKLYLQWNDPGKLDGHAIEIHWGDGIFTQFVDAEINSETIFASHTYETVGERQLTILIVDSDFGTHQITTGMFTVSLPNLIFCDGMGDDPPCEAAQP